MTSKSEKRAARALMKTSGLSYQAALHRVREQRAAFDELDSSGRKLNAAQQQALAPLQFNMVVLVCKSCKAEHTIWPPKPLTTPEVKPFLDRHATKFCRCPATTCDVKLLIRCPMCPHRTHGTKCSHCSCTHVFNASALKAGVEGARNV